MNDLEARFVVQRSGPWCATNMAHPDRAGAKYHHAPENADRHCQQLIAGCSSPVQPPQQGTLLDEQEHQ